MKPYYQRNGITIYCGDCLEVMPKLEPPFDAIIADLPYGTTECEWDSPLSLEILWLQYHRLLKLNGAGIFTAQDPFASILATSNIANYRHKWVWIKDKAANFIAGGYSPLKYTEDILVFCRAGFAHNANNRGTYNPQMTPGQKQTKARGPRKLGITKALKPRPVTSYKAYLDHRSIYNGELRYPENYLYFPVPYNNKRVHPTQKPEPLMSYLIRTYTNPGELILDNTMGSGTTLVAAKNEGRQAVGIELSEEYCKIAVERLRQPSLFTLPSNNPLQPNGYRPEQQPLFADDDAGNSGETRPPAIG